MKTKHFGLMLLIAGAITFAPRDLMGQTSSPGPCANNMQQGTTAPPNMGAGGTGYGDPVEAYSGNDQRPIVDLQMFAGVGTHRLAWVRYANTRYASGANYFGTGANVRHSYQWEMVPSGSGFKINYPEGAVWTFNPVSGSAGQYAATAACPDRLFQNGSSYVLQKSDGSQYYFQLVGAIYEMVYFRDLYGSQYNLSYDTMGRVTQVSEPGGRSLTVSYSGNVVATVSSSDGRVVTYNYGTVVDPKTKVNYQTLNSVVYPDGTQAQYSYAQLMSGTRPVVMSAVDPRTEVFNQLGYTYYTNKASIMGQIASQVDLASGTPINLIGLNNPSNTTCPMATEYANQGASNYWSMTEATGHPQWKSGGRGYRTYTTFDQGGYGFLNSVTDANGYTTAMMNSAYGNLLTRTNADASVENWTRDAQERLLSYRDPLGRTTTYNRDGSGRVTSIQRADGTTESFTYNSLNQMVTHTLPSGAVESRNYDARGLMTSATDPLANTTSYGYDSKDHCTNITDALGRTTQMSYNDRGQVTQLTHADGTMVEYGYDAFGNLTNTVDESGAERSKTYDAYHQVTSTTDPLGNTTSFGYYALYHNLPNQVTLPSGKTSVMGYDTDFNMTNQTVGVGTPDAATTSYTYDKVGNVSRVIDGAGRAWSYSYDSCNRKIAQTDPLGNKTQYAYDAAGNVVRVTQAGGQVTSNVYDTMNRLVKSTDALGNSSTFTYDASGNLVRFTDAKGNSYSYTYDALNRKLSMSYPDKTSELWSYDAVGNMTTYTTRAGQVCTYTYDNRNRVTNYAWSDSTPGATYNYDAVGRLLSESDGNVITSYTYDAAGNLLSESRQVNDLSQTVAYSYDEDGNLIGKTYPDGTQVGVGLTGRNQVAAIATNATSPLASYTYNLSGTRATKALENGTVATYSYDNANRLIGLTNTSDTNIVAGYKYTLTKVGLRSNVQETTSFYSRGNNFYYDSNNQLTNSYYGGVGVGYLSYSYDTVGNRTSTTSANGKTTTVYLVNNCNQYTNVGSLLLSYDKNGNMTSSTNGTTYSYDAKNRLVGASSGSNTMNVTYDTRSRVVSREINGTTIYYAYDGWNLIGEYDTFGNEQVHYIYGPGSDEPLCMVNSDGTYYYHQDGNGNVAALTDESGSVVESYAYDPYGKPTIYAPNGTVRSTSAVGNRFMFSGREYIPQFGLYDYRNRVYSPVYGRFLQTDPIRFQGGDYNIYRYCGNSPVNYSDPDGLCFNLHPVLNMLNSSSSFSQFKYDPSAGAASGSQVSNSGGSSSGGSSSGGSSSGGSSSGGSSSGGSSSGGSSSGGSSSGGSSSGGSSSGGLTLSANLTTTLIGRSEQYSVNWDQHGGFSITKSEAVGLTPGGSATVGVTLTTASSVSQLNGISKSAGGAAGEGPAAEFNYVWGDGYKGFNMGIGVGAGAPIAPQVFKYNTKQLY
jgi:RHS repeat-associated protein